MLEQVLVQYFFYFTPVPFLLLALSIVLTLQGLRRERIVRLIIGIVLGFGSLPFVALFSFLLFMVIYATQIL